MSTPAYTTLSLVKQYLAVNQESDGSIISGRDDALIADGIPAFSQAINDYLEYTLQSETVTAKVIERQPSTSSKLTVDAQGFLVIKTPYPTIQSVASVDYKTNWTSSWIAIDSANYIFETLDPTDRPTMTSYQIRINNSVGFANYRPNAWRFWVRLSYVGGYATTPDVIARACTEWVAHDYRLRQFIPTMSAGFIGMPQTIIAPKEIPPHVERMLRAWQRKWQ